MKKNVMLVCYPSYGGSGVVATELGKELADRDYQVHFVSYELPIRLIDFHPNISFHEVKPLDYPLFKFPMYEGALTSSIMDVCVNQKIDIVHAHYAIPHAYAALLAKQAIQNKIKHQVRVVTTLHGTDITLVGREQSYKPLVEYAINASDAVSCVSQFLKQKMYEVFDIQRDIKVVNNFIDIKQETTRENTNHTSIYNCVVCEKGDKVVTHISNFRTVKRVKDVLKVFYSVLQLYPAITLLMVGDGPDRYEAEAECRVLNICHKVKFMGKVEQIDAILNLSDVFILPSENESFGLAALEALSCGVPVVATSIGGIPEVVIHGECGYLHPLGDVHSMAMSTLKLLQNEDLWNQFSKASIQRSKLFYKNHKVDQYESLYNDNPSS